MEDLAAVGGSHALTEAVDLGTLTLLGLIGTLHAGTPPDTILRAPCPGQRASTTPFGRGWQN